MAPPDTASRTTPHAMVRGEGEWYCVSKKPRCDFTTTDWDAMLGHVTGRQQDLRHLPPIPDIVGEREQVA